MEKAENNHNFFLLEVFKIFINNIKKPNIQELKKEYETELGNFKFFEDLQKNDDENFEKIFKQKQKYDNEFFETVKYIRVCTICRKFFMFLDNGDDLDNFNRYIGEHNADF